ncbi:MAG TPA: hypothetical protein VM347_34410 [Nonomuraea sp.]|nr:hypothetical protein [Nonomuraea sp.]
MAVWTQDEAGPYQAIPQPGAHWRPATGPARYPHEHIRHGTAKLLTLFEPASGRVHVKGVTSAANAVLHPWLESELTAILAALPEPPAQSEAERRAAWERWQDGLTITFTLPDRLPPLRLLLVLDNLSGHKTPSLVLWLVEHGVMPLYTPLSGSWLNMAERRPHQCRSSTEWRQPDGVYHGAAPRPPARGPCRVGGPAVRPASRAPMGDRAAGWQPPVRPRHLVYAACRVAGGAQRARERAG